MAPTRSTSPLKTVLCLYSSPVNLELNLYSLLATNKRTIIILLVTHTCAFLLFPTVLSVHVPFRLAPFPFPRESPSFTLASEMRRALFTALQNEIQKFSNPLLVRPLIFCFFTELSGIRRMSTHTHMHNDRMNNTHRVIRDYRCKLELVTRTFEKKQDSVTTDIETNHGRPFCFHSRGPPTRPSLFNRQL